MPSDVCLHPQNPEAEASIYTSSILIVSSCKMKGLNHKRLQCRFNPYIAANFREDGSCEVS